MVLEVPNNVAMLEPCRHDLAVVWDWAALRTSYAGLASETSGTGHRAVADARIPLAPPRGWPGIE